MICSKVMLLAGAQLEGDERRIDSHGLTLRTLTTAAIWPLWVALSYFAVASASQLSHAIATGILGS